MTEEELREIEARCEAATPGPWYRSGNPSLTGVGIETENGRWRFVCQETEWPDATFIAAAREDVPVLVAEVRRLQGELAQRVPQVRDGWKLDFPDCPWCGKPCQPKAHLLGDEGWLLWFECDDCGHDDDMLIDWPFEPDLLAVAADFANLGFEVTP